VKPAVEWGCVCQRDSSKRLTWLAQGCRPSGLLDDLAKVQTPRACRRRQCVQEAHCRRPSPQQPGSSQPPTVVVGRRPAPLFFFFHHETFGLFALSLPFNHVLFRIIITPSQHPVLRFKQSPGAPGVVAAKQGRLLAFAFARARTHTATTTTTTTTKATTTAPSGYTTHTTT
jgi:hypothetical protein